MKVLGFDVRKMLGGKAAALIFALVGFLLGLVGGLVLGGYFVIAILLVLVIVLQLGTLLLIENMIAKKKPAEDSTKDLPKRDVFHRVP